MAVPALGKAPLASLVLSAVVALAAAVPAADLEPGPGGRVVAVVDGDTVVLDGGEKVRLVGIQAPKLSLGRAGFTAWPLAEDARAALESLVLDRMVSAGFGGRRVDRHGRVLAHLWRDDGLWLQGEMVRRGLARVYSFADNRALVGELHTLEQAARTARRGIWADPFYRVRGVGELDAVLGTFQLVEGRVAEATVIRGRLYLNFGDDWRTDFTATAAAADRRRFEAEGLEPAALHGALVRVRGWLESYNGPMIVVDHREQIEVLVPAPAAAVRAR